MAPTRPPRTHWQCSDPADSDSEAVACSRARACRLGAQPPSSESESEGPRLSVTHTCRASQAQARTSSAIGSGLSVALALATPCSHRRLSHSTMRTYVPRLPVLMRMRRLVAMLRARRLAPLRVRLAAVAARTQAACAWQWPRRRVGHWYILPLWGHWHWHALSCQGGVVANPSHSRRPGHRHGSLSQCHCRDLTGTHRHEQRPPASPNRRGTTPGRGTRSPTRTPSRIHCECLHPSPGAPRTVPA